MSAEIIGLWLGVAGFVLSFIGAYAQIKGFFIQFFRASTSAAKKWAENDVRTAELYLRYPSALVAYLAGRLALFVVCLFLILILRPVAPWASTIHPWLGVIVNLAAPVLAGLILGAISANCATVGALARKKTQTNEDQSSS